jgi:hypothetical protein
VPECVEGLAGVAASQGEPERAFRLAGAAAGLREIFGHPPFRRERRRLSSWLDPLRQLLGEPAVAALWQEAEAMSVEHVIAHALDDTPEAVLAN